MSESVFASSVRFLAAYHALINERSTAQITTVLGARVTKLVSDAMIRVRQFGYAVWVSSEPLCMRAHDHLRESVR